jgi:hypothetical protein
VQTKEYAAQGKEYPVQGKFRCDFSVAFLENLSLPKARQPWCTQFSQKAHLLLLAMPLDIRRCQILCSITTGEGLASPIHVEVAGPVGN